MQNGESKVWSVFSTVVERVEMMGVVIYFAQCEVRFTGGVCVWARTDNPATLHSLAITAPTNNKNFNVVVD